MRVNLMNNFMASWQTSGATQPEVERRRQTIVSISTNPHRGLCSSIWSSISTLVGVFRRKCLIERMRVTRGAAQLTSGSDGPDNTSFGLCCACNFQFFCIFAIDAFYIPRSGNLSEGWSLKSQKFSSLGKVSWMEEFISKEYAE